MSARSNDTAKSCPDLLPVLKLEMSASGTKQKFLNNVSWHALVPPWGLSIYLPVVFKQYRQRRELTVHSIKLTNHTVFIFFRFPNGFAS